MEEVLRFALLGLGVGALYSLASQGLVLVYRGSGVLNFAHGAIGTVGAFIWWDLRYEHGHSFAVAVICGVLASAALGALVQLLVMRRLRHASPLAKLVGTLGVLIVLQALVVLRYGTNTEVVLPDLPTDKLTLFGDVAITADRLILVGIAALLTAVLWATYRYTRFGIGTTAVAESQRSAAALGWSPEWIATVNWTLGSALAGIAAILIAPIVQLQVATMTGLTLAAMSAALVAGFRSFPIAFAAGLAIGVAQTILQRYVDTPGLASSLPFAVIVAVLIFRGQALPVRGYFLQRLPAVGNGRIPWIPVLFGVLAMVAIIAAVPVAWVDAITVTLGTSLVLLSIVVLTGYTGQISLAQFAFAGMGAYIAGRLVATQNWPFELALLAGVVGTIPIGVLFALPAVRTRGITLAVVTLGLGSALELMVFNNGDLTGGYSGTSIDSLTLFGLDMNAADHPERFAFLCLGMFAIAAFVVANLRRGGTGRRLLAVRTNERAAAALGIGVTGTKLYAFAISSGIAALGGIMLAFRSDSIVYTTFSSFQSITSVGLAVVGGVGYVLGPIFGSTLAPGALGTAVSDQWLSEISKYIPLIGGITVLITVLGYQDGVAHAQAAQVRGLLARVRRRPQAPPRLALSDSVEPQRVIPRTLEVRDLVVRYGGVTAVSDLSLTVEPGRIVGLIGPNGAGKTSAIDAITGFAPIAGGSVHLDGRDLSRSSAAARARAGLSRSFQSLELFEDLTVLDNLRAAAEPHDARAAVVDLVRPANRPLGSDAVTAVRAFGLEDSLDTLVKDLPYGQRRLVAIARAVARHPSVLLLDEPAAGLGDRESAELARVVRRLPDEWGIGVLLVEHHMGFVMSVCDDIVVLDFGREIAAGPPAQVRTDPAVIAAYLGETEEELEMDRQQLVSREPA
jgi:sulfate-transporting ATPase